MKKSFFTCFLLLTGFLFVSAGWSADFDGQGDNQLDSLGYYYAITGGKFPNGQIVNGDNASGGTFRYLLDDPAWGGYPLQVWNKDDWFPENAGLALTMKNEGLVIFDNFNNDDGDFYSTPAGQASAETPGLYRGYCMSNNWDWIYAGYFKLSGETTIDEIIGYFDENAGFDRNSPHISYRLNIWSNKEGDLLPAVNSFSGDVLSSDSYPGTFSWGDTGVDRVFGSDYGYITDDIFHLTFHLDESITLPAGEYWFSHDAIVTTPIVVTPNPVAVGTDIFLSAVVTDDNGDVASAWYSLDGGTAEVEMDIINNPSGYDALATVTFTVSEPGVYNLCAYGKNSTHAVLPEVCTMLVIYDPSAGFVTGGGWIDSPAGAMPTELSMVWNQGFETDTSGWFDSTTIDLWHGIITQAPSGTDGIMSARGAYHAMIEGDGSSAPFSRFDGYRDTWAGTWTAEIDVYLDPAWTPGQGFDYSVAANGSDGAHQRDYIFHVTKDTSTNALYVAGSNNSNFAPREDLENINHYVVATAGWYTLQHVFYDQDGALAVDLNLLDSNGTVLFTETRYDSGDFIPEEVGGNRYAWFTFNNVENGIAVDDHQLFFPVAIIGKANFGFVSKYKKGAMVPTGSTEFVFKAGDLNFHSNEYDWLVVNQAGTNAQFKGVGTINGVGMYKFMIWASDSEEDTFRIKIWVEDNGSEVVVYDNGVDQVISSGNIVVHAKKE